MSDEPMASTNTPTSWRDVYQLVQDSERRLTQTITDGFQRQSAISQDHEVRIRVLEASDQRDSASNRTVGAVIGVGRSTLLTILSAASMVIALLALVTK